MSSKHNPETPNAQAVADKAAADKRAEEVARQSGMKSGGGLDEIMSMIMEFLKFLFDGFLADNKGQNDAPHEAVEDDAPDAPGQKVEVSKNLLASKALPKWQEFQQNNKGKSVEFHSPVKGDAQITSGFGHREAPKLANGGHGSSEHKGIDIGARGADKSPDILAAADGVVLFAGHRSGYGHAVILGHADGTTTIYGHLSGKQMPKMGASVAQGDVIGEMGNTGHSTGAHLHFEVRKGDKVMTPKIDGAVASKGKHLNDDAYYASLRQSMPKFETGSDKVDQHVASVKPKKTAHIS